ncbi:hypothetical protein KSC_096370 [Ktedonobacter sp. SOSP1-52]|uniref:glycosyltransferase family 2 protein n=1 Tax=Ktedonobacter sp. SOSP1-52 TaxID=2778366 RepID=UPI0019150ED8|nr:glycosyltransferase family 2 protein [Ktedonobacter sp. SOSP1-52]GHO70745.1 hypothetical protein KSC_096370 [Ktedonobacter sp. SOSP1-52]
MALVDVLIPTYRRKTGLAIVLASLFGQTFTDFNVIVSDQSPTGQASIDSQEIHVLAEALRFRGHDVKLIHHPERHGMAEQRQFLLGQSNAPYVHYIDDDVLLEPQVLERMLSVIQQEQCGFVGSAAPGIDYLDDVRPHQQQIEIWDGPVTPEPITPESIPWERAPINSAANPLHLEQRYVQEPGQIVRYKVAWVGGANVLFDRQKLLSVGGFSWWERMPREHAGEEVVVQFLLLRKYGGCGILPCGTYHLCLPTTIEDRQHNATTLFKELLEEIPV